MKGRKMNNGENFTFEIKKQLCVLATHSTGWKKELNIVEWNGNEAKLDVRDWSPEHDSMSKGVTFRMNEAKKLMEALNEHFKEEKEVDKEEDKDKEEKVSNE